MAVRFELSAEIRGSPVLPDDGAVDRFAGRAIPEDNRLPLIGDADRIDLFCRGPALLSRLPAFDNVHKCPFSR